MLVRVLALGCVDDGVQLRIAEHLQPELLGLVAHSASSPVTTTHSGESR